MSEKFIIHVSQKEKFVIFAALFALSVGLVILALISGLLSSKLNELRKDVNRVSRIQVECSVAIERGFYAPDNWSLCIDDFMRGMDVATEGEGR